MWTRPKDDSHHGRLTATPHPANGFPNMRRLMLVAARLKHIAESEWSRGATWT